MAEEPDADIEQTSSDDGQTDVKNVAEQALADAQASVDELKQEADSDQPAQDVEQAQPQAEFVPQTPAQTIGSIDMLRDVNLHVTIELGRTQMLVEDVLKLSDGAVVELDKLAGDPVDVYVNDCLMARGEVLVLNDNFCIRISEIVANLEERAEEAAREQVETV